MLCRGMSIYARDRARQSSANSAFTFSLGTTRFYQSARRNFTRPTAGTVTTQQNKAA